MTTIISTTAKVKESNKAVILQTLFSCKHATKIQIAKETGLSVATCNTLLNELLQSGAVKEAAILKKEKGAGRPSRIYQLNQPDFYLCLLQFSQKSQLPTVECRILDAGGIVVYTDTLTDSNLSYSHIHTLLKTATRHFSPIKLVTIGIPGTLREDGTLLFCPIHGLEGVSLAQNLEDDFGLLSNLYTEMDLISLGFTLDNPQQDYGTVLALSFEDNKCTGCGITMNHDIYQGKNHMAGDISFLPGLFEIQKNGLFRSVPRLSPEDILVKTTELFIRLWNPDVILLTGKDMHISLLGGLTASCSALVSPKCMPELIFSRDNSLYCAAALMELGMQSLRLQDF